jgi:hypothetical protein
VSCGNAVELSSQVTAEAPGPSQRCTQCGGLLSPGQQFCGRCGAQTTDDLEEAAPVGVAASVIGALEARLVPYGSVVLVERPGSKRSRRCEMSADSDGRISDFDLQRLMPLLEETLVWDGYLLGEIRAEDSPEAKCVWHVLNGGVFPLSGEHATSLLFYLEALQPARWSEGEAETVTTAPDFGFE